MKYGVYCIKDKKGSYGQCIFERSDYDAKRNLETFLLSNLDSVVVTHPFDFIFLKIGSYDDKSGKLESDIQTLDEIGNMCAELDILSLHSKSKYDLMNIKEGVSDDV